MPFAPTIVWMTKQKDPYHSGPFFARIEKIKYNYANQKPGLGTRVLLLTWWCSNLTWILLNCKVLKRRLIKRAAFFYESGCQFFAEINAGAVG
jgi:hypothetical protein